MACDRRKQPRREQFVITLEGMPGFAAPPIVRVRRAIKQLGRAYGLKVVDYRAVTADGAAADAQVAAAGHDSNGNGVADNG
jgi:hypothetical protein